MKYNYSSTSLTGGGAGALDAIDGANLADLDSAIVYTLNAVYIYSLDADSAAAEDSPSVISPDANAGDKRWVLTGIILPNTGLRLLDSNGSHVLIVKPGSDLTADRILTITTGDAARTLTLNENFTIGDGTDITITGVVAARTLTLNENFTVGDGSNITITAAGGARTLLLNEGLTIGNGADVTITAVGSARTLTLNENLTVGDGSNGTITFTGAGKTISVEDNSVVNQDLTTDATPAFAGWTMNGVTIKHKVLNIGDWNMDSTASVSIAHGLTVANIRTVQATIRNDDNNSFCPIDYTNQNGDFGSLYFNSTNVVLERLVGEGFDNANYDSTSYNRGYITIWYV